MSSQIHLVSKTNNANHTVVTVTPSLDATPLPPSSIRARTALISLTSNNLSYARNGTPLHWWSTYPPPASLSPPYDDITEWGIVPAWGYAVVTESTIPVLQPGSHLFGLWPTSSHTVTLALAPIEPEGHWIEQSPHRARLLPIYNRYRQVPTQDKQIMAMKTLFLGTAGFLLNHFVFSTSRPTHPLGLGGRWSREADLSRAVVASLSASSKTGRFFAWELARDRDRGEGPLALLQLTSVPEMVPRHTGGLPTRAARYDEDVVDWIAGFKSERVVIVDFGAAEDVTEKLVSDLAGLDVEILIVVVGAEPKVYTDGELRERMARNKEMGKAQLNTGALLEQALTVELPSDFTRKLDDAWLRCYEEGGFGSVDVKWMSGVQGPDGIEGAWSDLCNRSVGPNMGMVVQLPGI